MKASLTTLILIMALPAFGQSGRKAPKTIPQAPPPVEEPTPPVAKVLEEPPPVTAEKNEDYRCTDDGSLARILEKEADEIIFPAKNVDVRAEILKVMLSANGTIGKVRVVRRLPYGLTENAIRVACKIKFKPAVKDGQQVSQWLDVDYAFRLADSSIYRR